MDKYVFEAISRMNCRTDTLANKVRNLEGNVALDRVAIITASIAIFVGYRFTVQTHRELIRLRAQIEGE